MSAAELKNWKCPRCRGGLASAVKDKAAQCRCKEQPERQPLRSEFDEPKNLADIERDFRRRWNR